MVRIGPLHLANTAIWNSSIPLLRSTLIGSSAFIQFNGKAAGWSRPNSCHMILSECLSNAQTKSADMSVLH